MTVVDEGANALSKAHLEYMQRLLAPSGLDLLDVARIMLELLDATDFEHNCKKQDALRHCRKIIRAGVMAHLDQTRTLPLECVVEEMLQTKQYLRLRTLGEVRQYYNRIVRSYPKWREFPMRDICASDCQEVIYQCFDSPSTQRKAMTMLGAIFKFGLKRGLCSCNPVDCVASPRWVERPIKALNLKQIKLLLQLLDRPEHSCCAAAVGIMLWAGVRPTELTRIKWKHINFIDKVIAIEPKHAKTGGARLVVMHEVLIKWLRRVGKPMMRESPLIPGSWTRRWKTLRICAHLGDWRADVLRHTYASYHLRHYKDLKELQINMGHINGVLLRTRYLSMEGITEKSAAIFWGEGGK